MSVDIFFEINFNMISQYHQSSVFKLGAFLVKLTLGILISNISGFALAQNFSLKIYPSTEVLDVGVCEKFDQTNRQNSAQIAIQIEREDVVRWNAAKGEWSVGIGKVKGASKHALYNLTDRCFDLSVNGRNVRGAVLSTRSARLSNSPVIQVSQSNDLYKFRLLDGQGGQKRQLMYPEEFEKVFGYLPSAE